MINALVSGASGPGPSPGRGHYVALLRKSLLSQCRPLSTLVYKWVPVNLILWVTLRFTSIPFGGGGRVEILLHVLSLHAAKARIISGLVGKLASMQT